MEIYVVQNHIKVGSVTQCHSVAVIVFGLPNFKHLQGEIARKKMLEGDKKDKICLLSQFLFLLLLLSVYKLFFNHITGKMCPSGLKTSKMILNSQLKHIVEIKLSFKSVVLHKPTL